MSAGSGCLSLETLCARLIEEISSHFRAWSLEAPLCGESPARLPGVPHLPGSTGRGAQSKEVEAMIMAGKPAPDFAAPAYHNGRFTHVRLSEHLGKWVLLFFYGGDYTFV
jgi:hypothetical protein